MSGRILLDTNIIIALLKGDNNIIKSIIDKEIYISFITELELLSYSKITEKDEQLIRYLFTHFKIIEINTLIKNEVIYLRKKYKLKLPDSIILATSSYLNIPIFSADKALLKTADDIEVILVDV